LDFSHLVKKNYVFLFDNKLEQAYKGLFSRKEKLALVKNCKWEKRESSAFPFQFFSKTKLRFVQVFLYKMGKKKLFRAFSRKGSRKDKLCLSFRKRSFSPFFPHIFPNWVFCGKPGLNHFRG